MAGPTADEVNASTHKVIRRVAAGNVNESSAGGGYLWLTSGDRPVLIRVDTRYGSTDTFPLPKRGVDDPTGQGIAFGGGLVWVGQGDSRVVGLDPQTLRPKRWIDAPQMTDIVRYGDNALWVANRGIGTIAKLDPRNGRTLWTARLHPGSPTSCRRRARCGSPSTRTRPCTSSTGRPARS